MSVSVAPEQGNIALEHALSPTVLSVTGSGNALSGAALAGPAAVAVDIAASSR